MLKPDMTKDGHASLIRCLLGKKGVRRPGVAYIIRGEKYGKVKK